jgi:hypothetical protein
MFADNYDTIELCKNWNFVDASSLSSNLSGNYNGVFDPSDESYRLY